MRKDPNMGRLLTIGEVAEVARTTPATVRYWRSMGLGPPGFRLGRRVLYREEGVAAWLADQEAAEARPLAR